MLTLFYALEIAAMGGAIYIFVTGIVPFCGCKYCERLRVERRYNKKV